MVVDDGYTIEQTRADLVTKIGENISIRRYKILVSGDALIESYVHGKRIGVLVEVEGAPPELARDLAMHIAASNPICISEADVPEDLLGKEREIQLAQAQGSGKSPEIIEKIDDYIEDTAEKLWYILKGLFKK